MITDLPPGFRNLALNHRLDVPTMTMIHKVKTKAAYINQVWLTRSGAPDATNLQEAESCATLLTRSDLTVVQRACCIGIMVAIVDCTRSERFSPLYEKQIKHHATELMSWQDLFTEPDLKEYYLWVCLDIAATLFPPKVDTIADNLETDERFVLLMSLMKKYGPMAWPEVGMVMQKFFWSPPCLESWENAWEFGRAYTSRPEQLVTRNKNI
jgi:hypothetical protein